MTPLVSIVLATYNRATVLAHAIRSVIRSTLDDWELIVVGDHCTDETEAVVASFGDPRLTFVNLESNVGEQSGPNNEGVRRARGRFLAFLNHDDLYFPDHLASAVAYCDQAQADLVWSPVITALPGSLDDITAGRWNVRLWAVTPTEDYDPRVFVFASAWVMRRELSDRVGPWQPACDTFATPSQDWLFRAWRSGARMRLMPRVSVMAVPAGPRAGSYAKAVSPEHDYYADQLARNPAFRETALGLAAMAAEREASRYRPVRALRSLIMRPLTAAAVRLGMHPYAPYFALRFGRRGNLINDVRRRTGLSKLPAPR